MTTSNILFVRKNNWVFYYFLVPCSCLYDWKVKAKSSRHILSKGCHVTNPSLNGILISNYCRVTSSTEP